MVIASKNKCYKQISNSFWFLPVPNMQLVDFLDQERIRRLKQERYSYAFLSRAKESTKKHAKERKIEHNLTTDQIKFIFKRDSHRCHYCRMTEAESEQFLDTRLTIDRVDSTKGYTIDNSVIACDFCNQIKSDYMPIDEVKRIGKIFKAIIKGKRKGMKH